jgi:hypothetical protein
MERSKIFIASSVRTLTLAEALRDELTTDYCEATLWTGESSIRISASITEMLDKIPEIYDFAVMILAQDDVSGTGSSDALKARDNCIFEAGMFMSAVGRDRCILMTSVDQANLPSDLLGLVSVPFYEPGNLNDRDACAREMRRVSDVLKARVQQMGKLVRFERVPLLTIDDLFLRERPHCDGGDLREGQVVVCDLQPMVDPVRTTQVRRNLDYGTSYFYSFSFSEDSVERTCQAVQSILTCKDASPETCTDFNSRIDTIKKTKDTVLRDLREICQARTLQISFMPGEQQFCFRLHNASDPELAKLYLRYNASKFMPWMEGLRAVSIWRELPVFFPQDQEGIFVQMKQFPLDGEYKDRFERSFARGLNRYFPGMQDEVRALFLGRNS